MIIWFDILVRYSYRTDVPMIKWCQLHECDCKKVFQQKIAFSSFSVFLLKPLSLCLSISHFLILTTSFEQTFHVGLTLFLGWYDVAKSHNVKSTLKQCCVRHRWNLQRLTTLKQRCVFQRWTEQRSTTSN